MASHTIPAAEAKPLADEPSGPVLFPPLWLLIWWGAAVGLVLVWREPAVNETFFSFLRPSDNAIANILTLLILVMTGVASVIWLWTFSSHVLAVKLLPIGLLLTFIGLFNFENFSGEMWPVFVPRWSAAGTLSGDAQGQADLAKTGPSDFPEFLGPGRSAHVNGVKLATDWQQQPKQIARWKIGAGWSGVAVVNGFGVTLEQREADEWVTCYDIRTGRLAWKHAYPARHYNVMGGLGPRSTPTIHEGRVYTLGATGRLCCLEGANGKVLWQHDLLEEFKLTQPQAEAIVAWGRAASPLIVDHLCVVPAGGPQAPAASESVLAVTGVAFSAATPGPTTLVAYDRVTGQEVWRGGRRQIGYASPTVATLCGVRQILSVNESTLTGHDIATGRELWMYDFPGHSNADANNSQPVALAGDRLFLSKGYGIGCQLVQVGKKGDGWSLVPIWEVANLLKTKFTNVVLHGGYVYGLDDGILECVELKTGERMWKRGRYEQGQILLIGDVILVQAESGDVVLVATDPQQHTELARLPAMSSQTWNNPSFAPPYLVVRNAKEAVTYELPLKP